MLPNINSLGKQFILFAIEPSVRTILGVGGQPRVHNWNHTRVSCVSQCLNSKFHFEIHLNQLVKISKQKHPFMVSRQGLSRNISLSLNCYCRTEQYLTPLKKKKSIISQAQIVKVILSFCKAEILIQGLTPCQHRQSS